MGRPLAPAYVLGCGETVCRGWHANCRVSVGRAPGGYRASGGCIRVIGGLRAEAPGLFGCRPAMDLSRLRVGNDGKVINGWCAAKGRESGQGHRGGAAA
jgi:hypothetical protein